MKLIYKFFLAFFVTNLAVVILLLLAIGMSLSSDVNDFVNETEDRHVKESIEQLIVFYRANRSWQPIINDVHIWRDIVAPRKTRRKPQPPLSVESKNSTEAKKTRDTDKLINDPARRDQLARKIGSPIEGLPLAKWESPTDILKTGRRMSLYDSKKQVIVGRKDIEAHTRIEEIVIDGTTIGWIGLVPSKAIKDSPASDFLRRQYNTYYLIAGAVLIISTLTAILLAKHLVAPIRQLIKGTSELRSGNFTSRIESASKDEIGILSAHFNDLAYTLEKNQKNRHQWVSDTSHELRTPLAVIKSQLIAIQDGIFAASDAKLTLFIEEIDKLSRIVDDLYQLSGSDIGGLAYKKRKLDPIKLLKQTLENYQSRFSQRSLIVCHSFAPSENCSVLADKDRMLQLFSNLIENSCRYTDPGGKINVITVINDGQLEIQIQDSAPGVSKPDQARLFERFYRVEQSRSRTHGGSGLGLALCSQIVDAHQGSISIQDCHLGGLTVIVTLPLVSGAS